MAAKKVGTLIKEARTAAGLTQTELAKKARNVTAAEIGKAERGETDLSQEQLKAIAKATGVTQKSLLEAPGNGKKTQAAKKPASSSSASASSSSLKLTAEEKKLVQAYRKADAEQKKAVMELLTKKEESTGSSLLGTLLSGVLGNLGVREMPNEESGNE